VALFVLVRRCSWGLVYYWCIWCSAPSLRTRAGEAGSRVKLLLADAEGLDHAIGWLVLIVFAAQENGSWSRLKACAACHWALYDRTKNRSTAWYGPQCGAQVRARRNRRPQREDPAQRLTPTEPETADFDRRRHS